MSAARSLTDADVEAIADAIVRKTRPLRARRVEPVKTGLSEADRRSVHDDTLARIARARARRAKK